MRRALAAVTAAVAIAVAAWIGEAAATSRPVTIVAIGASNTSGWGVGGEAAYPARLEALLRERGYHTTVINAGVPFQTTYWMLGRIDRDVPDGTRLVIIQPGGNDLRFFGSKANRAANIEAMVAKLRARGIQSIVYDPVFAPEDYQWDRIHLNARAHAKVAQDLLPEVIEAIDPRTTRRKADGQRTTR